MEGEDPDSSGPSRYIQPRSQLQAEDRERGEKVLSDPVLPSCQPPRVYIKTLFKVNLSRRPGVTRGPPVSNTPP